MYCKILGSNTEILCYVMLSYVMVHSIRVGQKFEDYQAFESATERYRSAESVQFYKRDSRTVQKPSRGYQCTLRLEMTHSPLCRLECTDIELID